MGFLAVSSAVNGFENLLKGFDIKWAAIKGGGA
jgi:hypothetical protein